MSQGTLQNLYKLMTAEIAASDKSKLSLCFMFIFRGNDNARAFSSKRYPSKLATPHSTPKIGPRASNVESSNQANVDLLMFFYNVVLLQVVRIGPKVGC